MSKVVCIDVETTGLDPTTNSVIEIAAVEVVRDDQTAPYRIEGAARSFVNPHKPIPAEASGINHILDSDVADAPSLPEALDRVLTPMWPTSIDIVAAHNARFDRSFLPQLKDKRWLCTWRCAMHCFADAPSFANGALFYFLNGQRPENVAPHSAFFDVTMTAYILVRLLKERTIDELLRLSTKAVVLKKVPFGKHAGTPWAEVPDSWLEWAAKRTFEDAPDVRFTAKHEINRRAGVKREQDK